MEFNEALNRCVDRRKQAEKLVTPCCACGSEQVQLVEWLDITVKFKCRTCRHTWSVKKPWEQKL